MCNQSWCNSTIDDLFHFHCLKYEWKQVKLIWILSHGRTVSNVCLVCMELLKQNFGEKIIRFPYRLWFQRKTDDLILLVKYLSVTFLFPGVGSRDEERLVRDLFRGYNKLIRPVQNMTEKVQVAFGLAFIQLINVVSL